MERLVSVWIDEKRGCHEDIGDHCEDPCERSIPFLEAVRPRPGWDEGHYEDALHDQIRDHRISCELPEDAGSERQEQAGYLYPAYHLQSAEPQGQEEEDGQAYRRNDEDAGTDDGRVRSDEVCREVEPGDDCTDEEHRRVRIDLSGLAFFFQRADDEQNGSD